MPVEAPAPSVTPPAPAAPQVVPKTGGEPSSAADLMAKRFGSTKIEKEPDSLGNALKEQAAKDATPAKPAADRPGLDEPEKETPEPKTDTVNDKVKPSTEKPVETSQALTWKSLKASLKTEQSARAAAEAKVREYESQRVPEHERVNLTQRMDSILKRNEELENEIRYVSYEKSTEFGQKYHQPYIDTLGQAMRDLARIPVVDDVSGQQRAATEQDLFELMNLDPVKQIDVAEAKFGPKLAQRVIAHADKVRDVLIARNKALEDAKANGGQREQQQREQQNRLVTQFTNKVKEWHSAAEQEWNKDPDAKAFDAIVREDGQQLTPEETEHNTLVEKGKELVSWVKRHPKDAKTPEEAAQIVRKQVAILKRAQYFGVLRRLYRSAQKKLDAAQKELAQYQGTSPTTSGRQTNGAPRVDESSFDVSFDRTLRRIAGK